MFDEAFRAYLRQWWRAAWAPTWDAFGWVSVVIGLVLWGWRKYWPVNFQWAADQLRLSPDAVSTDLVWQIPIVLGACVMVYRLLRAPYEIHVASERRAADVLALANARIAELESDQEFKVEIEHAQYGIQWDKPDEPRQVWMTVEGVVITNQTPLEVPLRISLFLAPESDSCRTGWELAPAPDWVKQGLAGNALPSHLNLRGRSVEGGFCVARIDADPFSMLPVGDPSKLAELPAWIEVENLITHESKAYSLNYKARNLDRARGKIT